jgi:hypothetical protein
MRTHLGRLLLGCTLVAASAAPALAQQTVNLTIGGFIPRSADNRVDDDVLVNNRSLYAFDIGDFKSASVGGEWLFPIGGFLEGGAGISFTRRTVPSVYLRFTDNSGNEIEQDFRLQRTPIDLTLRVTPLGRETPVQVYFGGGLTVVPWRYNETGDFIDFNDNRSVFSEDFQAKGTATGAVALGGVRFQSRTATAGFEVRYHKVDDDIDPIDFSGSRIDLGGWTYQGTLGVRF